jgi:hypothetical protein
VRAAERDGLTGALDTGLGGTSVSTDTGEYAGDGTIGPSVIGRGGIGPGKVDEYASPHVGRRIDILRAMTTIWTTRKSMTYGHVDCADDFVPPPGLG